MLFPVIRYESTVQVDDQTRIDASKSYVSQGDDAIDSIEIDPGSGFVDVTATGGYLDHEYSAPGEYTVTVRVDNGSGPVDKIVVITALSAEEDGLFSDDGVLTQYEPDILTYVREGRNSYKDVHRRVQKLILDWLDSNRYWKKGKDRYELADLIDIQDFREWAALWALSLIYEGLSDKVDDKWMAKALKYKGLAESASERGTLRLDVDADGTVDDYEKTDNISKEMIRR